MEKTKIKNKSFLNLFIFIFLIVLLIFLVYIQINNFFVLDKINIYTEVILGDKPGFDLNKTALTFGRVIPGNAASREIFVENNFDKTIKVEIISTGDISNFLSVSENNFILVPKENKTISFSVFFPIGNEMKKYTGEVEIKIKNV